MEPQRQQKLAHHPIDREEIEIIDLNYEDYH
jgi:hypothetical protein